VLRSGDYYEAAMNYLDNILLLEDILQDTRACGLGEAIRAFLIYLFLEKHGNKDGAREQLANIVEETVTRETREDNISKEELDSNAEEVSRKASRMSRSI